MAGRRSISLTPFRACSFIDVYMADVHGVTLYVCCGCSCPGTLFGIERVFVDCVAF